MIALALLLAAQSVPKSLLDAADEADGIFVQCLFATSRAASAAHLSVDDFERKLSSACQNEEAAAARAGTAVLKARGERNAASKERQSATEARQSVLDTYRRWNQLSR